VNEFEESQKADVAARQLVEKQRRDSHVANPFLEKVRERAAAAKKEVKDKRQYTIDPQSKRKIGWDLLVGSFILHSVCVIPWRISFNQEAAFMSAAYFLELVMDLSFGVDMCLSFFTGIYDPFGRFVSDKWTIGKHATHHTPHTTHHTPHTTHHTPHTTHHTPHTTHHTPHTTHHTPHNLLCSCLFTHV